MFEVFFNNCEIRDKVPVSEEQSKNIRSSLKKRLAGDHPQPEQPTKEEKTMKKSTTIRTILIAAAVAAVGGISLIGSAYTVSVSKANDSKKSMIEMIRDMEAERAQAAQDAANSVSEEEKIKKEKLEAMEEYLNSNTDTENKVTVGRYEMSEYEYTIMTELAEVNQFTPEFIELLEQNAEENKDNPNGIPIVVPSYRDMIINKLIVTGVKRDDMTGMLLVGEPEGIVIRHMEIGAGKGQLIKPDGNGGYVTSSGTPAYVDEKLLEAIAEGTEKYGDTFTIYY